MCKLYRVLVAVLLVFVTVFIGLSCAKREPQCESINTLSLGLDRICGYNTTARFLHDKHLDSAVRAVRSMISYLGNCSNFGNLMICSLFVPRCEEDVYGPFLPCKGVCYNYASQCQATIERKHMQWTAAMCDLLPEKDDPQSTKGYRGRCFEPPDYKESGQTYQHQCSEVVVEDCQGIPGYTHTVISKDIQLKYAPSIKKAIGNITADPACGPMRKQIVCTENMPACINGTAGFLCRNKCEEFFGNCKSPFFYKGDMCMEFPARDNASGDSEICKQTHWPRAENWPKHDQPPVTTPTTTTAGPSGPSGQSGSNTTATNPNSDKPKAPGEPEQKARKTGSKKTVITGSLLAVVLILVLVCGIAVFLFYRRRRNQQFSYQKQVLYSDYRGEDDFQVEA